MNDAVREADAIERGLRAVAAPERAAGEKRYLKSDLDFLGATVWEIRGVVTDYSKDHPEIDHDRLFAIVEELWSKPIHERRMAAVFMLEFHPDLVGPRDLKRIERLVRDSRTWALVDGLAASVLGGLLIRYPKSAPRLDRWARDEDFWVRRSALLAWLLPLKQGAPLDRFEAYADAMLDEKEFFIRKAIGWVWREVGKTRPDDVYRWLAPRTDRVSGVTIREGVKYLDEPRRDRLMAAYRAKKRLR